MDLGLRGRAAFVAASSRGMGRAIAEEFAAEGADVGLCARGADALGVAANSVIGRGVRAVATVADVGIREQAHEAVTHTIDQLGRLDALVVNTGGPPGAAFVELAHDDWLRWFDALFMSSTHLIHAALPALRSSDSTAIVSPRRRAAFARRPPGSCRRSGEPTLRTRNRGDRPWTADRGGPPCLAADRDLARADLRPGELGAALMLERCAVLQSRLVAADVAVPSAVVRDDDPVRRFRRLEQLRDQCSDLAAPWTEVLTHLRGLPGPGRARALRARGPR